MSSVEEEAILKEVEDFAWDRHSTLTKSDISRWNLDEQEYARLQWDEQGYLVIQIDDVKIVEQIEEDGVTTWYVSAIVNTGQDGCEPDVYSCYMGQDGKYCIEWDHS